ncbi:MAG TPA: protein-tyrosine phosphatase family protein [Steroidobacteraceae bacterium]|jgi:hypothetical protein|nr:protein-tyrosine phosphatase family protein [Steroidobacteraceae bacterium]
MNPPPRPLPNTYWVVPNRILAGEYPGGEDETHARERIALFARAGIDAFFDLTEEGELPPYRHLLPARSEYLRSGIADTWVPTNPSQTQALIAAMRAALRRRRRIYVHCRAGIGRTGLVIGCFLADQEADGRSALKQLNELWRQSDRARDWPRIPQTAEQADYIQRWPQLAKSAPRAEPGSQAAGSSADAAAARAAPARGHPAARTSSAPASRSSAAGPMSAPQDGSLFRSIGRANTTARTQAGTDGHGAPDHKGPRSTQRR